MQTDTPMPALNELSSMAAAPPQRPASAFSKTTKPLAPFTVTEAFTDLLQQQEAIKRALDVLIADATTLRAQL